MRNADPAAFEIIKNTLYKIAEEMRVVLAKTAYSPLLKSAGEGLYRPEDTVLVDHFDSAIHR